MFSCLIDYLSPSWFGLSLSPPLTSSSQLSCSRLFPSPVRMALFRINFRQRRALPTVRGFDHPTHFPTCVPARSLLFFHKDQLEFFVRMYIPISKNNSKALKMKIDASVKQLTAALKSPDLNKPSAGCITHH